MVANGITTKFVAILALDIAGYTRLMELDEAGTFTRVQHIMEAVVGQGVAATGGRVVKTTGDGALAEWPDARAAVTCALAIQARNEVDERTRRPDRRARLRIGLHAGEVIAASGDIFGEGVNIASRLESIAGVGEIYTSGVIAAQAAGTCSFVDLGERRLKNIARPVRVFRAAHHNDERAGAGGDDGAPELYVPGFGDRPAIAVLPFRDGGTDRAHLADGVTEGVISALARWHSFPVISRNSVYALVASVAAQDQGPLDLRLVGQQLGVRYVLEGSLLRAGSRLRITVRLIDVDTDTGLMTETHECEIGDVFALQDQLVRNVVGQLEPALLQHERARVVASRPTNPTAYEMVQLGTWHHYQFEPVHNAEAQAVLARALEIEPGNIQGLVTLALVLTHAANVGWHPDGDAAKQEAMGLARRALVGAPRDPSAWFALGTVCQNTARPEEAAAHLKEALRLNPSHAAAHANLGFVYCFLDRPDEALPEFEVAMRLSPFDPRRFLWTPGRAASHYLAGRYRAALSASNEALLLNPRHPVALRYAAAALGAMDRRQEAQPLVAALRQVDRDLAGTASHWRRSYNETAVSRLLDGLRRAGMN